MPTVLIQNGTVVNADSTARADVLIDGGVIKEVRPGIPANSVQTVVDATGLLLLPGGIDAHTHLDMPFGGTNSADDFLTGTRAAAIGGTTTIVDFAIQARGTKMRTALDTWWKKAEGKACIDYGLHMIVTDLGDAGLEDMDDMVREGVASFKLFMAYPNVLMVDDATIFKAMRQTAKNGALICMHAENGSVIDVIVQQALAEGKTAPIYHALTRPTRAEAEAVHRAIAHGRDGRSSCLHCASLQRRRAESGARSARSRPARLCRNLPAVSAALARRCGRQRLGRREVCLYAAAAREEESAEAVGGLAQGQSAGGVDRSLPVLFRRSEGAGQGRLHQDSQWRPGHREPPAAAASSRRGAGQFLLNRFVELVSTAPARIFGMYPKKGVLAAGSDADIVLWDPTGLHHQRKTHHMRVDYSMFEGFKVRGNARDVYSRGELIVEAAESSSASPAAESTCGAKRAAGRGNRASALSF
jgi:dihydropyrimidinase